MYPWKLSFIKRSVLKLCLLINTKARKIFFIRQISWTLVYREGWINIELSSFYSYFRDRFSVPYKHTHRPKRCNNTLLGPPKRHWQAAPSGHCDSSRGDGKFTLFLVTPTLTAPRLTYNTVSISPTVRPNPEPTKHFHCRQLTDLLEWENFSESPPGAKWQLKNSEIALLAT